MNPGSSIRLVSLDSSFISYFYLLVFKYFLINTWVARHIQQTAVSSAFSHASLSSLPSEGKRALCFIDELTEAG